MRWLTGPLEGGPDHTASSCLGAGQESDDVSPILTVRYRIPHLLPGNESFRVGQPAIEGPRRPSDIRMPERGGVVEIRDPTGMTTENTAMGWAYPGMIERMTGRAS
jgi:hypothetical protein